MPITTVAEFRLKAREGDYVRYVPRHAFGDASHGDCENGRISSFGEQYVFVKFDGSDTAKACDPRDLLLFDGMTHAQADWTGHEILSADDEMRQFQDEHERRLAEDRKRHGHLVLEGASIEKAPVECSEALRLWDAGEYVVTADMSGFGPGYESCIQNLAFELIREFSGESHEWEWEEKEHESWWKSHGKLRRDRIVELLNERFGFTGAQVGAATNLAFVVMRCGYRAALSNLPRERLIRARKTDSSLA